MQRSSRWSASRMVRIAGVLVVGLGALAMTMMFTPTPAGASCDIGNFANPDGSVDITSYLQCSAPALSDSTVAPGGTVTFTGGGFRPGSVITITFFSDPIVLGTTTADSVGNFSVTVVIPDGVPLGDHHLEASGVDASGQPFTVSLDVTVGSTSPLARTGSDVSAVLGIGFVVIVLGAAALLGARRVRTSKV